MEARGVPTNNLSILRPCVMIILAPNFHFAFKACTGGAFSFPCGHQVMYAERVRMFERLYEREIGFCGVIDMDAAGAGS